MLYESLRVFLLAILAIDAVAGDDGSPSSAQGAESAPSLPAPSFCISHLDRASCLSQREGPYACTWSGDWPQWKNPLSNSTLRQNGVCFQDRSLPIGAALQGAQSPPPFLDILRTNPSTKAFYAWMTRENIDSTLSALRSPVTVFALSDVSFEIVLELMNKTGTLEDPALRSRLLLHHFVPALVPEQALINASYLGTLAGPRFYLRPYVLAGQVEGVSTAAPSILINDAAVGQPSIRASNGVVYVMDEPPVTPLMVLNNPSPAWADPRYDSLCTDLLRAVQSTCSSEMCGLCHTSICASASATGCQFKSVTPNETFRDATTGTFAVCRRACPAPETALQSMMNQSLLNATFLQQARAAPGIFSFETDQDAVGVELAESSSQLAEGGLPPCDPECGDLAPPSEDNFTCAQQVAWGKCRTVWMVEGDWCRRSCRGCFAGCRSLPLGANCSLTELDPKWNQTVPCGPGLNCSMASGTCVAGSPAASTSGAVGAGDEGGNETAGRALNAAASSPTVVEDEDMGGEPDLTPNPSLSELGGGAAADAPVPISAKFVPQEESVESPNGSEGDLTQVSIAALPTS